MLKAKAVLDLYGFRPKVDGRFTVFVKSEKLCGFQKTPHGLSPLETLIDRIIQAPADPSHCIAGPPMKTMTHKLKQVWNHENHIFYASVSVDILQTWTDRVGPRGKTGVCVDYTMFDSTHSLLSWALIESLYTRAGFDDPDFLAVLEAWREPVGYATGKGWALKYFAPAMNASGRDDTSLVNALLNGIVIFFSMAAAYHSVSVVDLTPSHIAFAKENFDIAVVGDDSLAYVPLIPTDQHAAFAARLSAAISEFGLDAAGDKIQVSDDPHEQVFLGMRLYACAGRLLWGRTIGRALYKFGWKCSPLPPDPGAHMASEAKAICAIQSHVPILSDFALSYLAWWGCGPVTKISDDPDRPWRQSGPRPDYDETTIAQVCRTYGLTLNEFGALRSFIYTLNQYPNVVHHPTMDKFFQKDL
jgi:hypothetical protein